jgi:hypothetical protein
VRELLTDLMASENSHLRSMALHAQLVSGDPVDIDLLRRLVVSSTDINEVRSSAMILIRSRDQGACALVLGETVRPGIDPRRCAALYDALCMATPGLPVDGAMVVGSLEAAVLRGTGLVTEAALRASSAMSAKGVLIDEIQEFLRSSALDSGLSQETRSLCVKAMKVPISRRPALVEFLDGLVTGDGVPPAVRLAAVANIVGLLRTGDPIEARQRLADLSDRSSSSTVKDSIQAAMESLESPAGGSGTGPSPEGAEGRSR